MFNIKINIYIGILYILDIVENKEKLMLKYYLNMYMQNH